MAVGDKLERKYLAHYIDADFTATINYVRLGQDLEEYNINLNPEIETKKNILGVNSSNIKGYEVSSEVDTFYAYEGDALFTQLCTIANNRSTGAALKTSVVDVLVNAAGIVTWAYREDCLIVPSSVGGDNGAINVPFQVLYNGNRVAGTWDPALKTFTPAP